MTLRTNLNIANSLFFIVYVVTFVWVLLQITPLGHATDAILHQNYRSICAADAMTTAVHQQLRAITRNGGRVWTDSSDDPQIDFVRHLTRAENNITVPGEREIIAEIRQRFLTFRTRLAEATSTGDDTRDNLFAAADSLFASITSLRHVNERTMYDANGSALARTRTALWTTVLAGLLGLVAITMLGAIFTKRLTAPLHGLLTAVRDVSRGHYDVQLATDGGDEMAALAREFNAMSAELARFHSLNIEETDTARRQAQAILDSMDDGIILVDSTMHIVNFNPSAARIVGMRLTRAMVHRPLANILPDEELLQAISSAIEDPPSHSSAQKSFDIVPSGHERSWVATFTLMESDTKPTLGAIIVLRDMTKAREIEKLKSDFIMAASHELRTPVTSIGMSIDMLEESNAERLTPPGQEMLRTAKSEVRRLRELVEDLLNLSRMEAGKIEIRRERVSVHGLFMQVQNIFAPQCAMKHIALYVNAAADCEYIAADQGKIAWVLTNLVSNALRYTPENGHIQMDARNAGTMVEITVRDTGPGIPLEYQSRIFERFVQFQHGGSAGGAGLGLAIAKEIVKAHGGTIWVDSVPGNGSTFTFTIASMPMERS